MFRAFFEMLFFGGEFFEFEVDEAVGLFDFIDYDVGGVVAEFSGSDFELLYVSEAAVFGGFAYGEDAVEEVVEFLGSGEVVLGDGACEVSFRGVGDDEQTPSVLFLEVHQFHHEESGIYSFVG